MSSYLASRRRFLKQASAGVGLAVLSDVTWGAAPAPARSGERVSIVVGADDAVATGAPGKWAVAQLKEALEGRGAAVRMAGPGEIAGTTDQVIVVASTGQPVVQAILGMDASVRPVAAEGMVLTTGNMRGRAVVLAGGSDALGLVYGVLELTDRVLCADTVAAALKVDKAMVEEPRNKTRSMSRAFQSVVEDKAWFNDKAFWTEYLSMLAAERFNRFNLCFGLHYNSTPGGSPEVYLFFAYPFLVSPAGYAVSAKGLPDAERDANLAMLKFIGQECARRGLQFQLGLWSHAYNYGAGANYPILGLNAENHAPYCRDALEMILKAVPEITGVTFRVHGESGIATGRYAFWQTLFEAFPKVGRKLEIDMHGKECYQQHIDLAVATGMRAVVSPKYVSEHMGLPYHEASLRESERSRQPDRTILNGQASRYGYANFFKEKRNWGVLHRIWPGTQRLLLWGDPVYAAGFGRAASFCGGDGVEWCEPLSFKGREGSGVEGESRCAYQDASLNPKYDYQKFLYTYRVWGRLLYNPDTDPQTWRRYLAKEYGAGAQGAVEEALGNASRILLLVTMYHAVGVANQVYWPEIYTNISIVAGGAGAVLSDNRTTTGANSTFDPQLFLAIDDYVEHVLSGTAAAQHKYAPTEVAQWLEDWATTAETKVAEAKKSVAKLNDPAFRRLEADVLIQSGLGLFFARKFKSAMLWAIYQKTGDGAAKTAALAQYKDALKAWTEMADGPGAVYQNDITFGRGPRLRGHWKDRVAGIRADMAAMETGEVVGNPAHAGVAAEAIALVQKRPVRVAVAGRHAAPERFEAGKELPLALSTQGGGVTGATLYYRHVNQADNWESAAMEAGKDGYQATIPAAYTQTEFPLQYYFAVARGNGVAGLYPGFDGAAANTPYLVVRKKG